jgi:hypothetical protein
MFIIMTADLYIRFVMLMKLIKVSQMMTTFIVNVTNLYGCHLGAEADYYFADEV